MRDFWKEIQGIVGKDKNPYRDVDEAENEAYRKNTSLLKAQANEFAKEYGNLVQDQRYGLAYKIYQNFYQASLDHFLTFNETSPEQFYVVVKNIQLQLRTLTKIVNAPKDFASVADEVIKRPDGEVNQ